MTIEGKYVNTTGIRTTDVIHAFIHTHIPETAVRSDDTKVGCNARVFSLTNSEPSCGFSCPQKYIFVFFYFFLELVTIRTPKTQKY